MLVYQHDTLITSITWITWNHNDYERTLLFSWYGN
jgi:hypothetical protein